MKRTERLIALALIVISSSAAPSSFSGPLPQEQKDLIHYMAEHHTELKRTVTKTKSGYTATTTSDNPELIAKLKTHFAYMKKRLDSGAMVRRWDPAYKEMVEYYDQLITEISLMENGIQVTVTGKTDEAVKVAQNHARIVSGFASEGQLAVQREHKAALE